MSIIAINWIFSPKRLNQSLQSRAGNEEILPRIHWIKKFRPIFKFCCIQDGPEDWLVYQRFSVIAMNWTFFPKRLNQNLQTGVYNEEKLPRIHWIIKFWPISKFCCLQNWHRRLVGLLARVYNSYKLNFLSKTAWTKFTNYGWRLRKPTKEHWIKKFWPISHFCCLQNCHRRLVGLQDPCQ